jgi:excisionase family DNA binding protein
MGCLAGPHRDLAPLALETSSMDEVSVDALGLLTIDDVAAILRISTRQAYRLLKAGAIDSFKVGRALRCTRQAVADYIAECQAIAAANRPE